VALEHARERRREGRAQVGLERAAVLERGRQAREQLQVITGADLAEQRQRLEPRRRLERPAGELVEEGHELAARARGQRLVHDLALLVGERGQPRAVALVEVAVDRQAEELRQVARLQGRETPAQLERSARLDEGLAESAAARIGALRAGA